MIDIQNVSFSYDADPFLENVELSFHEGAITSIIGANGSGKSTLLMLTSKLLRPKQGVIHLNGHDIASYSIKSFAQHVAVVHQKNTVQHDMDVATIVSYGRLPYRSYYQPLSKEDMILSNGRWR